jgi:ABC-2 type transport system ATP-binding protein
VLFLDEPTIGLDVTMQKRIRSFVAEYNARYGATVLLTSHYMADVQALCKRVIVIHHGRILFDGELTALANRFGADKTIGVTLKEGAESVDLTPYGDVIATDEGKVSLKVGRGRAPEVAGRLLHDLPVADLTIEDPPIEDVIESVFADAKAEAGAEAPARTWLRCRPDIRTTRIPPLRRSRPARCGRGIPKPAALSAGRSSLLISSAQHRCLRRGYA